MILSKISSLNFIAPKLNIAVMLAFYSLVVYIPVFLVVLKSRAFKLARLDFLSYGG
jgi:hypothetical protein